MTIIGTNKLVVVPGHPYKTDGGKHAASPYGQSILGDDGSTSLGEIIAETEFVEKVIAALNHPFTGVPIEKLGVMLGLAESQIEDVATGLADGTYEPSANPDHELHSEFVGQLRDLFDGSARMQAERLAAECAVAAAPRKTVTFYFDAHACDDHGDGPQAAKLCVDQAFVCKLLHLQGCLTHTAYRLSEVRTFDAPDCWLPEGVQDELVLTCAELSVTRNYFWFTDRPKHAHYMIESDSYCIADLVAEYDAAVDGQTIRLGESEFLLELEAEMTGAVAWNEATPN